jgi:hypothetical protein
MVSMEKSEIIQAAVRGVPEFKLEGGSEFKGEFVVYIVISLSS